MKKWFWNLFKDLFKKELTSYVDSFKESHYLSLKQEHEIQKIHFNYPIGQKVIIRSNEPGDLLIGTVSDYQAVGCHLLLVVEDSNKRQFITADSSPPYWTKDREAALRKLNWAEQWNVLSKYYEIDSDHKDYKESEVYQNR